MRCSKWQEVELGDICDTISDTIRKDEFQNVVLINTSDVLDGEVTNHILVRNKDLKGQFKKKFIKNDILYSEIRPKNKRFAYIDFDSEGYIASTKLMVLRNRANLVSSDFLYTILKSDFIINQLQHLAETRSGTFPQITFSELSKLKILLPSIEKQKEIVNILFLLDNKIKINSKINENLEEQAQAIFRSCFLVCETNGTLGEIILEHPKSKIKVGDAKGVKGIYPFYTSGQAILQYNIALVSGRNCYLNTGGNADVKFHIGCAAYSTDTWCITGTNGLSDYLYLLLKSISTELNNKYFEGSALKHLQKNSLKSRSIYIPTQLEMIQFNEIVNPIFDNIISNNLENNQLILLRDTLLPKLMSGELDVLDIEL